MSAANLFSLPEPARTWLSEYLKLQDSSDKRVNVALQDAMELADAKLSQIERRGNASATVRTSQLNATRAALHQITKILFKKVEVVVREEQSTAASLAEGLLVKQEKAIWRLIFPDKLKRAEKLHDLEIQAARGIQATMTRLQITEHPLSRRVYKSEAIARGQVDREINRHMMINSSADEMARDLRKLIDPNVPGGVSYRAKTLSRTEINNAFHAQSIADAQSRPWIQQMDWNLSKRHDEQGCVCETYSNIGTFHVDQVPKKPHPRCLCTVTPRLPDLDTVLKSYMSGQYSPMLPGTGMV